MSALIAKAELLSLTDFQRDLHVTKDKSEEIVSTFYKGFTKSTWYSSVPCKLACSTDGEIIVYKVNNAFHYLSYTYMRYMLPAIRVKQEYSGKVRIKWTHNIGTSPILSASFKEDDDTYQTFDYVWSDIFFQFYQPPGAGKRKAHNIGIGNVQCLEEFSEFLPAYPINVDQPWFYSLDPALAFPIFLKNSLTRAEHRYTMRRKIQDLLIVEVKGRDGIFRSSKINPLSYLDINGPNVLRTPELWGRYAYVTESEMKFHKCKLPRTIYTRDIAVCDSVHPKKYDETSEITLECNSPCLAMFWVSENKKSTKRNLYSNYTTDSNNVYAGWDPIKSTTLKYGIKPRLDAMPSDHFSIAEPRKRFPSSPNERGYHGYSFSEDSTNHFIADVGVDLSVLKGKLLCDIADNNLFLVPKNEKNNRNDENEDEDEDGNNEESSVQENIQSPKPSNDGTEYITRARLLIVRKFTMENDEKDGVLFSIQ